MTDFAREYGTALYDLALEENLRAEFDQELEQIAGLFQEQPDFARLLDLPSLPLQERLGIVDEVFGQQAHPYIRNFLKILTQRQAAHRLPECQRFFHDRCNLDLGRTEATVTTAAELSDENAARIQAMLEKRSGKTVKLIRRVDPSLIGGVRVEMDGHRMDNSVAMRLEQMRRRLTEPGGQ